MFLNPSTYSSNTPRNANKAPWIATVTLLISVVFIPLVSKINYYQNDDWDTTSTVGRFLEGDFSLLPVTSSTFYGQGLLGYIYALAFGLSQLPFLTLIVSALNFFVFAKILLHHLELKTHLAIVLSLIFFLNPIHMYSSLGFMTENYLLFYFLCAIYFLLKSIKTGQVKSLLLSDLFSVISFLTKQNGIILLPASAIYFFIKKKYLHASIQIAFCAILIIYYKLLFPTTQMMQARQLTSETSGVDLSYTTSLILGSLIVTISLFLPLFLTLTISFFRSCKNILQAITLLSLIIAFYFLISHIFNPESVAWGRYPYFRSVFEREGFFPRSISGTKASFHNVNLYFDTWGMLSKILLASTLALLVKTYRRNNIFFISTLCYLALISFIKPFFDRYLVLLFPLFIIFIISEYKDMLVKGRLLLVSSVFFSLAIGFLSTQFATDFVLVNRYVWTESNRLIQENGINKNEIRSTYAWNQLYGASTARYKFFFSYNDNMSYLDLAEHYSVMSKSKIGFPLDIFADRTIYIHQGKEPYNK